MSFYAFKKNPPSPRNIFNHSAPAETTNLEQVIIDVLRRYPEAYRVVMDEMQRVHAAEPPAEKKKKC